ncbi:MAG: hypothetical protein IJ685_04285 [Selenomonadaceae bacterium]|nr:hypothetical protein [Selenomonadaceae bacterium]
MTEQEKINSEVQMKLAMQDAKFNVFMQEMRDRDNQRAAEIMELRQRQDAAQAKQNSDMKAMDAKIDRLGDKIQNMLLAAIVGFGAIMFAAVSALK